jgi:hypothetical protein
MFNFTCIHHNKNRKNEKKILGTASLNLRKQNELAFGGLSLRLFSI